MGDDILTPAIARKHLEEIRVLAGNKTGLADAKAKAERLAVGILATIEIHGDQRSRALMAIYQALHEIKS